MVTATNTSARLGLDGAPQRPTLVLAWSVADLLCAVDVCDVVEVLPPVACRPLPLLPAWMRGLFVHRGQPMPLIDAAGLLGLAPSEDRMANRVLVVRIDGENAGGRAAPRTALGIWVHRVIDLARVDFRAASSHPGFESRSARFLGPLGESPWGLVQRVAPRELLDDAQWELLAGRQGEDAP